MKPKKRKSAGIKSRFWLLELKVMGMTFVVLIGFLVAVMFSDLDNAPYKLAQRISALENKKVPQISINDVVMKSCLIGCKTH